MQLDENGDPISGTFTQEDYDLFDNVCKREWSNMSTGSPSDNINKMNAMTTILGASGARDFIKGHYSKDQFKDLYEEYWSSLTNNFYKNPYSLSASLKMLWIGIDMFGQSAMPEYGWGTHTLKGPGIYNPTDTATKNMVKSIQAAIGGIKVDGMYGTQTQGALARLGFKGWGVGQKIISKLSRRLDQALNFGYVWPTIGRLSSRFGPRTPPVWYENGVRKQGSSYHQGIDIANATGTDINAFGDGSVIFAGWATGNTVVIDHGSGLYSYYFHLDSYSVGVGDYVSTGQFIADMGNTGGGTGSHLHFGISTSGQMFRGYVDPLDYLP